MVSFPEIKIYGELRSVLENILLVVEFFGVKNGLLGGPNPVNYVHQNCWRNTSDTNRGRSCQ